jgi:hypothetical protein
LRITTHLILRSGASVRIRFTPDRREHIAIALASDDKLDELPIVRTNSQRKSHRVRSRIDAGRFSGLPVFYFHGFKLCNGSAKVLR